MVLLRLNLHMEVGDIHLHLAEVAVMEVAEEANMELHVVLNIEVISRNMFE